MNHGNFVNVVAYGSQNHIYNNKQISVDYLTEPFENNVIDFNLDCFKPYPFIITPEYVEMSLPNVSNSDSIDRLLQDINLKNSIGRLLQNINLKISIGSLNVLNLPFKFLVLLNKPIISNNKVYVKLAPDMFITEFNNIIMNDEKIFYPKFELIGADNFSNCKLIFKGKYQMEGIKYSELEYNYFIQYLSLIDLKNINNNFVKCDLSLSHISKGFFISCDDVDQINEIKINLNDKCKSCYNTFFIKEKCVKIHQKLLYFPFNFEQKYNDLTTESCIGSINFERIEEKNICIKFNQNVSNVSIYVLATNILKYIDNKNIKEVKFAFNDQYSII